MTQGSQSLALGLVLIAASQLIWFARQLRDDRKDALWSNPDFCSKATRLYRNLVQL